MSNLSLVPDTGNELPSQQVARRIRGIMAEHQISGRRLAEAMHMDQKAFSRRYSGKQPWAFDEMVKIAPLLGTTLVDLYAIRDSNPEPADWEETGPDLRLVPGFQSESSDFSDDYGTDSCHDSGLDT